MKLKKGICLHSPIIDKEVMMEHFDTLNTVHISKKEAFHVAFEAEKTRNFSPTIRNITVGLSSGTSGNRGVFSFPRKNKRCGLARLLERCFLLAFYINTRLLFSYVQIAIYTKRQKISESHFIFLIY